MSIVCAIDAKRVSAGGFPSHPPEPKADRAGPRAMRRASFDAFPSEGVLLCMEQRIYPAHASRHDGTALIEMRT